MKILWFTNTPSNFEGITKGKDVIWGGWISSLEKSLISHKDLQLGIVFNYKNSCKTIFQYKNLTYFPIPRSINKIKKLFNRTIGNIDADNFHKQYLDVITDFNPDLIHVFGTENAFGLLVKAVNIPVVIQIQGILTVINQKYFSDISRADVKKHVKFIDKIKYDRFAHYRIQKKMAQRERNILSYAKNIIGRTDWDRRITSVLAPDARYFKCDELLRDKFYNYTWTNIKNENNVLVSVLRDSTYKGLDIIYRSALLLNKLLNKNYKWKIIGIDRNSYVNKILTKKIKGDFSKLVFLGELDELKLIMELLSSNIYIHTSYIDNSPNSLCEAMMLGLPIISTNVGGIPSFISNHKNGILISPGDYYELAGSVYELYNNYEYAIELGRQARRDAKINHDKDNIINTLLNIYNKILNDQK